MNDLIALVKQRWKYYLPIYVVVYLINMMVFGYNGIISLFPIKLVPLIVTPVIGNTLYYRTNNYEAERIIRNNFKLWIYVTIFIFVVAFVSIIVYQFGFNIFALLT